jgi:quercetin dioxygenase-like cupin family protein
MHVSTPGVAFADGRGEIIDLLQDQEIHAATLVTFRKGAVRGNHYHRDTTQWNYVLSGRLIVRFALPAEEVRDTVLETGQLVMIAPQERHAFLALEDATLAVFTKGPRGGKEYESDTFRVDPPLIPHNEET